MSMKRIEELREGMLLGADVISPGGRLLLKKGAEISEATVEMLARMGVHEVNARPAPREVPPEVQDEAADYARVFFLHGDAENPATVELYRIAAERTALAVMDGWDLPTETERRAKNVEHLSDLLPPDVVTAEAIVRHETDLVSFPDIYFRIKDVLDDPTSSAERIARVVSTDMSLSAKLLQLVNSPFYGFSQKIDSISRAVSLVGVQELSTLALGISAVNYFRDIPPELIDMPTFWRHSISCGIVARILAETRPDLKPERFFIAGLLHDVGKLILFKKMPYAATEAMIFARENAMPLVEAERKVIGFNHTDVAVPLLDAWKFPESLSEIICAHHAPQLAEDKLGAAVVHLADNITNALEISLGGMYVLPGIEPGIWELLGQDAATFLPEAVFRFDDEVDEILRIFA